MQRTGERGSNALSKEFVVTAEASSDAPPEAVYRVLADLSTHLVWAGERQGKRTRLLTLDAPAGQATVGTEWRSTGADPMGSFADRSVVTEATVGEVFEFVTEARLTTKKGVVSDWTLVARFELEPAGPGGCRIVWTSRVTRISALAGSLRILEIPGLRRLALAASAKVGRRSARNLARVAEERVERGR
jgi:uncharacterized protein YndB with AHSA1/START domain